MIKGHGDDAYLYPHIESNFSSNICPSRNAQLVMAHLACRPELVSHYPEPEAWSLERMIAERLDIAPEQVIVTNGATEAIYLIAQAFSVIHSAIAYPTFMEYENACDFFQPVQADHTMMWICNPNNPTGQVYRPEKLDMLLSEYYLLVVDQSYEDYTDQPILPAHLAVQIPNMIQIHSFTKTYCIPGLRLGYITAPADKTAVLRRYLRPWSVSALSIEAGKFLLQHDDLRCRPDLNEAQRLRDELSQIPGILTQQTFTNFMLCQFEDDDFTAADLKDYLARQHHMLIRDASNFRGLTARHFRVAAQTPRENDALVAAIREYVANGKKDRGKKVTMK